ncbi:MAG: pilus assembly protein PilX [Deltaproteobacteria bacterium]|nr:pilus assembly protein PilX [Deltaproteobacteria bacterium]
MKFLNNERGIALVTSLMLTLIALAIIMALMYFVTAGIQMSAASKRYKNVVDAGYGGVSLTVNEIIPSLNNAIFGNFSSGAGSGVQKLLAIYGGSGKIDLTLPNVACLQRKLDNATADWGTLCGDQNTSLDPKTAPDFTFVLKSDLAGFAPKPGYRVYSKIVNTPVKGNTDKADRPNLRKGENVTESAAVEGTGITIPTTYRIEIRAEGEVNPLERANISVLYAF